MFRGIRGFKKDIDGFVSGYERGAHAAVKRVAKQWFKEVVDITPKDTGFASSKWKYKVNSRPPMVKIKHPTPGRGNWTPAKVPTFYNFKYGDTLYMYNNVEYIVKLEQGWSEQAPKNFFLNATIRARRRMKKELKKLDKK